MDPWPMIEADRTALSQYLATLSTEDWHRPSLCEGWTIEDVAAHLLVVPTVPKGRVFLAFLGSGFNLDRFSDKMVQRIKNQYRGEQLAAMIGSTASSTSVPPGLKPLGVLSEVLVHAGDISLVMDQPLAFPAEHYIAGLDHLKDAQPVLGCKERIQGLRLQATDGEWSHGDGPSVEGTAQHLLLVMTGRAEAAEYLSGDGVATVASRC